MIDTSIATSLNSTKREKVRTDEYQLTRNVIERFGSEKPIAFSPKTFRLYKGGIWNEVDDLEVEREITHEVEAAFQVGGVNPTLHLTRAIAGLLKNQVYVRGDEWNKYPNILVFKNKALDTDAMLTLDHNPEHMATIGLPHEYDQEATAPTWDKVLNDLLNDHERKFFQEFAGYCLTHSVKHQMTLWLVGPPGGGKSTLIKGLETMLGKLSSSLRLSQLTSQFGLSRIMGKTLLTCTEVPKQHLKATDILNALITGDTAEVEEKYAKAMDYQNTAKFIWAMNNLPSLYEPNNGLFRRAKILEVPAIPEEKKDISIMERVALEGPGITNWALEGLTRLNQRGEFTYPKSVDEATKSFKRENDLPAQFIEDCCDRPDGKLFDHKKWKVLSSILTEEFNTWARGHKDWSQKALAAEWRRLGLTEAGTNETPKRESSGVYWYGLKMKD